MAAIRISFNNKNAGAQFRINATKNGARVGRAAARTALDTATDIEQKGRANISAAGRFGRRWTDGFHAIASIVSNAISIRVFSDIPYFNIFEYGGIIRGKPMLWIPLSFASDAKGVRARDYPGPLFRVNRKSGAAPLLLTTGGVPKYFGKERITMPRKFRIRDIIATSARAMKTRYSRAFRLER